jgi:hypothetical protein
MKKNQGILRTSTSFLCYLIFTITSASAQYGGGYGGGSSYGNSYGGGYSQRPSYSRPYGSNYGYSSGHDHHDHRDYDDDRRRSSSSSNKKDKNDTLYRYRGKNGPDGNHTIDWWHSRGYQRSQLDFAD